MKSRLALLAAVLISLAAAHPAAAQKFIPRNIQFKGAPEYTAGELFEATGLKKGVALTTEEMNDHSKQLMATGLFDELAYKFDGVDLVYSLTPAENLYTARFDNFPFDTGKELEATLHKRFSLYHGRVPGEAGLLEQVRGALQEMLAAQGFQATVTATPSGSPSRKAEAMTFSITAPPVRPFVESIEGAPADLAGKVNEVLKKEANSSYDSAHSPDNLERAAELFLTDRGYAAAKATATRSGAAKAAPDAILVPFSVTIQPGVVYKVGAIHLPAGTPVTADQVKKALTDGPNAPLPGIRLRGLWELIATSLHKQGYLDAKAIPHPQFDEAAATVNYTVEIVPGPVYHLAFVKFDGVSDEVRKLLIKCWQPMPGDAFDQSYASTFLATAQQQEPSLRTLLAGVRVRYDVSADPQTHDVNVVVHFMR